MREQRSDGDGEVLAAFSDALAAAVARAGVSVTRVEARRRQAASGIVWSADGLVLTADHVLERDEDIALGLSDNRTAAARIVGRDPGSDLALLKADTRGLTPIERGPAPSVGHLALVVARPDGGLATSIGVVSAVSGPVRTRGGGRLEGFIRTDATFYPGFSGAPLVDPSGRMIGLATSRFGRGRGTGLAIPLNVVDRVVSALQAHGRVRRGYLGVSSQPIGLPDGLRSALGLQQSSGLVIIGVEAGGPAERGGFLIGDILVAFAGQPVRDTDDLRQALGPEQVGQVATARVIRGGQIQDLSVTVGERS